MILYLSIPISLCLWLIVFGVYQRMNNTIDPMSTPTKLSFQETNNTVIFLVLDAFRYDYVDKFKFTQHLLQTQPQNSILLKMIVSAPTMTTQKIQVMMSGHEMTYKSIIGNFMASKSTEDSILNYVRSISIGDDTWSRLYQHQKSIDCQSFIVSDLHSCDKLVINNLIKQYKSGQYDLLIGHFLGLDHIGHTFSSVSTVQTNYKLNQISQFLNRVVDQMDNKTMLIVVGDHGMKSDGNHGGSSKQQTETIMFAYSKGHKLIDRQPKHLCYQGDITATLSMLLNIQLPNNSLGGIIYSALPQYYESRIQQSTQLLRNHISKILKRIGIEYQQNQQIQTGNTVKAKIKQTYILITIIVLILFILSLILYLYQNILEIIFILVFPITNFSWFLLKNQQTYLQILLLITFFIVTVKYQKPIVFIDSIVTVFVLCQFQPHRKDQYKNSIFHLDFISNFLQNSIVLLLIKLAYFISKTTWKNIATFQRINKILLIMNIVMYQLNQEWLCYIKTLQLILVFVMIIIRKQGFINTMQSLILIFSGKKGLLMLAMSDTLKLNLNLTESYLPYLAYYISQAIWLGQGNRADFSTIDIKASYIFTNTFIPSLNFICLVFYQMCSYIHFLQQLDMSIRLNHVYSQIQQNDNDKSKISKFKVHGVQTHLQYLLIPMIGALFSLISLYMNVGKILFTVVYVPLSFFCILKMITLYLFITTRYLVIKFKCYLSNKNIKIYE